MLRQLLLHLGASAGFALFGAVYERFSPEVYSSWMIYAYAFPLLLGAIPGAVFLRKSYTPGKWAIWLWNAAVFTWTTGSVFKGVLEIYGTTNQLAIVYPVIALALLAVGAIFYVRDGMASSSAANEHEAESLLASTDEFAVVGSSPADERAAKSSSSADERAVERSFAPAGELAVERSLAPAGGLL